MKENKTFSSVLALCAVIYLGSACSHNEIRETQDRTGEAVNDTVDTTRGVLKNVVEGIDHAVYR